MKEARPIPVRPVKHPRLGRWTMIASIILLPLFIGLSALGSDSDTVSRTPAAAADPAPQIEADAVTVAALAGLTRTVVSEYGMDARMRETYDYASCSGLHRYGTQALNTSQWGWVRGYAVFECAYDTATENCFDGRFAAVAGGQWFPQMVYAGRCYSR